MTNDLTIYITIGSETYLAINESDELVLFTTKQNMINNYMPLGKVTKARIEELKGYLDQLSIHAEE